MLEQFLGLSEIESQENAYRGDTKHIGDLLKSHTLQLKSQSQNIGFNALLAGCRHGYTSSYTDIDNYAYFGADSASGTERPPGRRILKEKRGIVRYVSLPRKDAYSVRCIKDK